MEIQTPDWVKHAVFYQIFPDRFARSQHSRHSFLNNSNLEVWDAPPTYQGYKGGDLWGVIEQLDYIESLGITAIYFTPGDCGKAGSRVSLERGGKPTRAVLTAANILNHDAGH